MKYIIWAMLLVVGIAHTSAQDVYTSSGKSGYHKKAKKKKGWDPDKLILGGEPTVAFGGGYATVGLSAIAGYRITDRFSAGIGLGYLFSQVPYYTDPTTGKNYYIRENIFYPNIWTRFFVYRNFFVTGSYEYDIISEKGPGFDPITGNPATIKENVTNNCVFVGAGVRLPLGGRTFAYAEVLYDLLQGTNSPYAPGFPTTLRAGFAVGL